MEDRIQLTPVSGLGIPVELSSYRRGGKLFCNEFTGQHYTTLPTSDGNVAYYPVNENKDDPAESDPVHSENVDIVDVDMVE